MRRIALILLLLANLIFAGKLIEVDLTNQKIYAIENGRLIFSGNISSGKYGHRTPRGNFKVIERDRYHVSNQYPKPNGGAKMHYMLRLTDYGIAIHQGPLPGYPASHGCIRVTKRTAKKLWRWAKLGTKVKIYGNAAAYVKNKKRKSKRYTKKSKKRKYYSKSRKYKKSKTYTYRNATTYNRNRVKETKRFYQKAINISKNREKRVNYEKIASNSDYEIVDLY
jgi:hypothetical protein